VTTASDIRPPPALLSVLPTSISPAELERCRTPHTLFGAIVGPASHLPSLLGFGDHRDAERAATDEGDAADAARDGCFREYSHGSRCCFCSFMEISSLLMLMRGVNERRGFGCSESRQSSQTFCSNTHLQAAIERAARLQRSNEHNCQRAGRGTRAAVKDTPENGLRVAASATRHPPLPHEHRAAISRRATHCRRHRLSHRRIFCLWRRCIRACPHRPT
jgi:hypothetical protein